MDEQNQVRHAKCPNCGQQVMETDMVDNQPACPVCEQPLDWSDPAGPQPVDFVDEIGQGRGPDFPDKVDQAYRERTKGRQADTKEGIEWIQPPVDNDPFPPKGPSRRH